MDEDVNHAILQADQDTVYEQDLLRDAGSVKPWLAYIEFKQQHGTLYEQAFVRRHLALRPVHFTLFLTCFLWLQVMERACRKLPRSYKLWKMVRLPFPCNLNREFVD